MSNGKIDICAYLICRPAIRDKGVSRKFPGRGGNGKKTKKYKKKY